MMELRRSLNIYEEMPDVGDIELIRQCRFERARFSVTTAHSDASNTADFYGRPNRHIDHLFELQDGSNSLHFFRIEEFKRGNADHLLRLEPQQRKHRGLRPTNNELPIE